jgi:inward rectifier potassium channel
MAQPTQGPAEVRVVNAPRSYPMDDVYHRFLRWPWTTAMGALTGAWFVVNALVAGAYAEVGGIANARPGSLFDAFDFSVQTFGTIGFGDMHPVTPLANALVDVESVVSLALTALATGLVFSKFARPTARIRFSAFATIHPMNGVPTLAVRVGNERGNRIVGAQLRMVLTRTERLAEGQTFYRLIDLPLARERAPALSRSFTVLHPIDERSPLHGIGPEEAARQEFELIVEVDGTDDVSIAPVFALHQYGDRQIVWGARHADILSELPDGSVQLDVARFHEIVPTERFPYRWSGPQG